MHNSIKKTFKAFTMAEVLITLGIIGIVAAMTFPGVMSKYRKKEVETKLAKIYSVMNQAINLVIAENGDYHGWVKDCGPSAAPTCTTDDMLLWYNETIGKQIKSLSVKKVTSPTEGILVYFEDGSILFINNYIYDMIYYTEEKAIQNPRNAYNKFDFRFNPYILAHQATNAPEVYKWTLNKGFEPYTYQWDGTREGLLEGKNGGVYYSCSEKSTEKSYCTKLIQIEGWKIPDDYPVKF